ncbi:MAG TPA: hypothetical protein VHQ64_10960 [Pyrinomonadaceae bacterium]|jgi:methionyl-tRNA formyltransferase|nr:hypothetical protein [Pyrinomonadaceae bacterium]
MSEVDRYVVAGAKPWSREVFADTISKLPGEWRFVGGVDELKASVLESFKPRFVFFLHWLWKVPAEIFERFECICFHMTDVPYGRGGSPLQNLILRGHQQTKLTALKMVEDFDAGPVYLKTDLSLHGSAQEIYLRANRLAASMIEQIIKEHPEPSPQTGEPTIFRRRKPEESRVSELSSLETLYDFVRMLDADGYPHAFIEHAGFRFEFTKASFEPGRLVTSVNISMPGK